MGREILKLKAIGVNEKLSLSSYFQEGGNLPDRAPSEEIPCRICLDSASFTNPFALNLCQCSARIPLHQSCFLEWVQKTLLSKQKDFTRISLGLYKCEICLSRYPFYYVKDGNQHNYFDIEEERSTFLIFEKGDKNQNDTKEILIVTF